ncbi:hypothetical protein BH09BAC3_BH09BAC3_11550 [soil metagenome]
MEDSTFKTIFSEEVYQIPSHVAVVIGIPWNEIKEDQRLLLSKILQAVKLSIDSVRMLHLTQFDLSSFEEKPSTILAFVTPPKGLASYEVVKTGQTSVIFSDPLESLITDDAAKRKLWGALKGLFES